MSVPSLFALAGVAGPPLAALATKAVEGLSFAAILGRDTATESAEATAAAGVGGKLPPATTLSELPARAAASLAQLTQHLTAKLQQLGVSLDEPLSLSLDRQGVWRASANHPQRREIESLLASDAELARALNEVAAHEQLRRAAEEHTRFAQLYAQNPELAVAQYAHLFDGSERAPLRLELAQGALRFATNS